MAMAGLADDLRDVVGGRTSKPLAEHLQLKTVGDLLQHYPRRYESRGELTDFADLVPGEQVTIVAEVKNCRTIPGRGGRRGLCGFHRLGRRGGQRTGTEREGEDDRRERMAKTLGHDRPRSRRAGR